MRLTLLGTGCPVVSAERYGPAHWIQHDETSLLVDCGSGVTQRMVAAGRTGIELDAVLLTHLHSDHIVDLFQLILSSWHQGRTRPQQIYGPPGTRRHIDGLMALWSLEIEQRIANERRVSIDALRVEVTELAPDDELRFGEVEVRVVEVDHQPVSCAFGFILNTPGERLALSGDTRYCSALIEAARDADVLVHEVFVHRDMPGPDGQRTAEGLANVAAYHTPSSEVGRVARECGARRLVLTHFVPPGCDRDSLLAEVSAEFDGAVIIGEDLLSIEVGTGHLSHGNVRLRIP